MRQGRLRGGVRRIEKRCACPLPMHMRQLSCSCVLEASTLQFLHCLASHSWHLFATEQPTHPAAQSRLFCSLQRARGLGSMDQFGENVKDFAKNSVR